MPQNHLKIALCQNAQDAIDRGYNYATQPDKFSPAHIEEAVVVYNGTMEKRPTVDFIFKDKLGNRHVAMTTGAVVGMIPCRFDSPIEQADLVLVSQDALAVALTKWEEAYRRGETMSHEETARMTPEQVGVESAKLLFKLLQEGHQ